MCTKIFVRAYAEPKKRRRRERQPRLTERPNSWFDGRFCVIDTETVNHELTFGAFEFYDRRKLVTRAVFYRDDVPVRDPDAFAELQRTCRERQLPLYSLARVFTSYIWKWRRSGGTFVFFNASYDLSRLATNWKRATEGERRGAFFINGFSFTRAFETAKDERGEPLLDADGNLLRRTVEQPFVRIKRDDRHHVRYDIGAAHVLDLATLAFALTDESGRSLQETCKAFGVEFVERPGEHSGEITAENVDGCLYDVQKTSELLYVLGREYDRHPIDRPPWRAQSGASLAKSYMKAFGVASRSIVQPDFPKEFQGFSATSYFGGRIECRVVNEPVPCAYIDAVSMYPTVFDLLDLWFAHVVPERLEPEELDPERIQALLDELHANPRRLLDPNVWPQLAFFALVDPNGATLPARPEIALPLLTRHALIAQESERIYQEQVVTQATFWNALDECGGKIIPDLIFERRRWRVAGEFIDLPRTLIRANAKRPQSGHAHGNIDEITQHVRDALNDSNVTTSDVVDFFKTHARPSKRQARTIALDELTPEVIAENAMRRLVSIGPVKSRVPLWFAGPDFAAAAISGTARPRILRAWRLRAEGMQSTLRPVPFRGEDEIDPQAANPFRRLIELRKRKSGDALDDELRSTGYKVIANSGTYGIFVETTPEDIDPDVPREERPVHVWELYEFATHVDRPERHSPLCFFPTAALVTAGARLMLALGERLVRDEGGEVAYCDTDSLVIVANEHGSFAPCAHGPYRVPNDARTVRALSWEQVDRILDDLATLNIYDRSAVPGSSFKLEDENFDEQGKRRELWFYGTREKSYALYALDARGEPVVVKHSAHTIGLYSSPIPGDREQRWIAEAWAFAIRKVLRLPVTPPTWLSLPALSQLTLTTANVMKHYAKTSFPFDFLAVAQAAYPGLLDCCEAPRPSCQLFPDIHRWAEQPWRCLGCGAPVDLLIADTDQSLFKTYERVVAQLTSSVELKRLLADGAEPTRENARGLTIPRPVRIDSIDSIEHMGKEVIVDPSEIEEGLTAELLGATRALTYRNEARRLDALRERIRGFGVSEIARRSGVSRSVVQAFVNQGKTHHRSTIEKLEQATRGQPRAPRK